MISPHRLSIHEVKVLLGVSTACGLVLSSLLLLAKPSRSNVQAREESPVLAKLEKTRVGVQSPSDDNTPYFKAVVPVPETEFLPERAKARPRVVPSAPTFSSVKDAAGRGCSTSSVKGLSKQIIAQSRCIDPNAFVSVPDRPNLSKRAGVFLYLAAPARDHLLKALDSNREHTLVVSSALRTVAQQYLLAHWEKDQRCGIQLAARPGESNHESGLALDIAQPQNFRSSLEAHGFTWLGSKDRVHFDYTGKGAVAHNKVDVMAFQQLWNRNHPTDKIRVNGRYNPQTAARLARSPASGFPKGARCGGG